MALTLQHVASRIGKLEHAHTLLQKRFDKLTSSFVLFWFSAHKPPAFGIVLSQEKDRADVCIFTQHLGRIDMRSDCPMLKPDDTDRVGKWEPLVLPTEVLDLLGEPEGIADDNSALTA